VTCHDRLPITPIPRADRVFQHWFVDCAGPFMSGEGTKPLYNYAFLAVDCFSRFPACFPLKNFCAKSVCDSLLSLWQYTGCCSYVSSDLGPNFSSQLNREFEKRMGCRGRPKVEISLSAVTESSPKVTYHIRPKPYVPPKVNRDFRPKTETESQSHLRRQDYRSQQVPPSVRCPSILCI